MGPSTANPWHIPRAHWSSMRIYIYIYIYIYMDLFIYLCIYIYMCDCVCVYIYGFGGALPATAGEGGRSHRGAVHGSMQRRRHRYEYTRALPATGGKGEISYGGIYMIINIYIYIIYIYNLFIYNVHIYNIRVYIYMHIYIYNSMKNIWHDILYLI